MTNKLTKEEKKALLDLLEDKVFFWEDMAHKAEKGEVANKEATKAVAALWESIYNKLSRG